MQVPDETVHARSARERALSTNPIRRDIQVFLVASGGFIGTGEPPDRFAGRVEDLQDHWAGGWRFQPIVEHGAIGRVLARGNFRRERSVGAVISADTVGQLRREQQGGRVGRALVELAQRSYVIEDPE